MGTSDRIEFGAVLDKGGAEGKLWLIIFPAIAVGLALVGWAVVQGSKSGDLQRRASAAQQQIAELDRTVAERDVLLTEARANEAIETSPGTAVALFYGVDPRAQESGVTFAHPAEKAASVYLYGLTAPPPGREYVVVARTRAGEAKPLGAVVPRSDGGGFLLAKDLPDGTSAIELMVRPHGEQGLERAEPRISARYPANGERGVLAEAPARHGRGELPREAKTTAAGPKARPPRTPSPSGATGR